MPAKSLVHVKVIAVSFCHKKLNLIHLILIEPVQEACHRSNNAQLATFDLGREAFLKMDSWLVHFVEVLARRQMAQQLVEESKDLVTFLERVVEAEGQVAFTDL